MIKVLLFQSEIGGPQQSIDISEATFLVCIHNISDDQPYAILRAPVSSTAQDIIAQVGAYDLETIFENVSH